MTLRRLGYPAKITGVGPDLRGAFRVRDLLPAIMLLLAGLAGLLAASVWPANAKGRYVVLAAPWSRSAETLNLVTAAHGRLIQAGRFSNIMIVASEDADFPDMLRQNGAWLVIASPRGGGCFDTVQGGIPTR